jgi:hypothetical protein
MEQVIWIEVLGRHRDVAARYRCAGSEVHVGRSYGNDVVLDDPYVAPRHLRIGRDDGGALVAEDLGSANGLYADRGSTRVPRLTIDGDRPFRIGHTLLRVRDAAHAVSPERTEAPRRSIWFIPLALAVVIIGLEIVSLKLNEVSEPKLSRYLFPVLALVVVLGWSGAWSVLARIFSGQAHFLRNLVIALSGLLAYSLYNELIDLSVFGFAWRGLMTYQSIGAWCLLAATCFFHLREVGPTHLRIKAAGVAGLAVVAIVMQLLGQSDFFGAVDREAPTRRLLPPAFRLAPVRPAATFFADVGRLQARLDRDRADQTGSWLESLMEDDD